MFLIGWLFACVLVGVVFGSIFGVPAGLIWSRVAKQRREVKARFLASVRAGAEPSYRIRVIGGERVLMRVHHDHNRGYRDCEAREEIVERLEQAVAGARRGG
jgi:hypothetical protein